MQGVTEYSLMKRIGIGIPRINFHGALLRVFRAPCREMYARLIISLTHSRTVYVSNQSACSEIILVF